MTHTLLENWCPISLVNVDTKIMTKAIAAGIKNVLPVGLQKKPNTP